MADLEEHAFKRDKRFVLRLALTMVVALLAGSFVFAHLTSAGTAGCATRWLGAGEPGSGSQ